MKFTIHREQLLKPLQQVAAVVEKRQTLPVLSNLLLQVNGQQLSMTGTDLELELVASLPLEGAVEEGATTVPARKLVDIARSLPANAEIRFELDGERMKVSSGRSRFSLSTLPAQEFPNLEEGQANTRFTIAPDTLRSLIDRTAFSMAQQDVRYYLNGMLFELMADRLRTVATDGHRLALCEFTLSQPVDQDVAVILPRKGVMELGKILGDASEDVTFSIGVNHVHLVIGSMTFTSKLVDGKFPDYERVIPRQGSRNMVSDRETLRQALTRVAILSNEKFRGVRVNLSDGNFVVVANNPEQEEAVEEISVDFSGESLEIGFNVGYLLDILNTIEGTRVEVELGDSNSSALIRDPENVGAQYVVMPMRL